MGSLFRAVRARRLARLETGRRALSHLFRRAGGVRGVRGGSGRRAGGGLGRRRAVDTSSRKPLARWSFTPPPGFRFGENDVTVPIGTREGFFVVEARRGDATEQVWINHTRLGVVTKEGPLGLLVWFVDLRTGRSASDVRASFWWAGSCNPGRATAAVWSSGAERRGRASCWPPRLELGVRFAAAAIAASGRDRFGAQRQRRGARRRDAAFSRLRAQTHRERAAGCLRRRAPFAERQRPHAGHRRGQAGQAGAFSAELPVPAGAAPGDYAVIAAAGAGGARLRARRRRGRHAAFDLVQVVRARRRARWRSSIDAQRAHGRRAGRCGPRAGSAGAAHRAALESDDVPPWGTTLLVDRTVHTGAEGKARIALPVPSDGLASTYGVKATTAGASASARVAVPTASLL